MKHFLGLKAGLCVLTLSLLGVTLAADEAVKLSTIPTLPGTEVVRAKFGKGPDDIGISGPDGPTSFALAKNGDIYILDYVNSRVQVFRNKKRINTIAIPGESYPGYPWCTDIDLLPDNKIVIMDKLTTEKLYIIDEKGKVLKELKLAGGGVPNPGRVSGVYAVNNGNHLDGVWVAVDHTSVRLADLAGNPDPDRAQVWGRFTYKYNRQMHSKKLGDFTVQVSVSDLGMSMGEYKDFPVMFDTLTNGPFGLGVDKDGNLYLGTSLYEGKKSYNIVTIFSPGGSIKKHFEIYCSNKTIDIYKPFRVSKDGKVYYMALDDEGVFVMRYDPWE